MMIVRDCCGLLNIPMIACEDVANSVRALVSPKLRNSRNLNEHQYDPDDKYEEEMKNLMSPILPRFYHSNREDIGACADASTRPGMDGLNNEFLYYTTLLQEMLPMMSRRHDRKRVSKWFDKLQSPAYHTARLRVKRNKYMVKLCLNAINDEAIGIFAQSPPDGVLPRVEDTSIGMEIPLARWEKDRYWWEIINDLPEDQSMMKCSEHSNCGENRDDEGSQVVAGALMDHEFRYFLYLARPFTLLLEGKEDQGRLALWLQTLAKIRSCSCLVMKGIRNDYMEALLGYLQQLRLGPFQQYPDPFEPLKPIDTFALSEYPAAIPPITDPSHPLAEDFLKSQPKPESGAFCFVAVTGDPIGNTRPQMVM